MSSGDADTLPLTDLEAAHLPDGSSMHSLTRPSSPTYIRPSSHFNDQSSRVETRPLSYPQVPSTGVDVDGRPLSYPAIPSAQPGGRPLSFPVAASSQDHRPQMQSARLQAQGENRPRSYPARMLSRLVSFGQSRPPSYPPRPMSSVQDRPLSDPSRPPSYAEQEAEEPLPSYMDAVKRKTIAIQQYPASKVPNRRGRMCLVAGFIILCCIILAVSIAVTRINEDNGNNDHTNSTGTPVS
ncbi:hypothetical protein ACLMJK_008641 [Lecanora helva]